MKHTKGPWKYIKSTSYHSVQAENNGPCDIARLVNSNREANAHLIAAAPDMLEALENLVERDLIKDKDNDHYSEVIELLKKARGES